MKQISQQIYELERIPRNVCHIGLQFHLSMRVSKANT
jgi:hypothetical protein